MCIDKTNSILLKQLPRETLALVLTKCSKKRFAKEAQIVKHMEEDNNLYFIEDGIVGVSQFSASGKEVGYIELTDGENFGELSAIDGKPRSASVIALTDCTLTVMPFPVFKTLIESNSVASIALMQQLTQMVRRLCDRIYEFSTLSVCNRIHAELLRLARESACKGGTARIITPPTHAQLASRLSCNREAVSRELSHLERLGVMQKVARSWVITDYNALKIMVDEVYKIRKSV